ncbi:hypothetical protein C8Q80DRAFT_1119548 [Daedaleopsis nitida]|nr:hypothetical protein C8Q80DRAFT_1119548 [Daedaleopsis nitida]
MSHTLEAKLSEGKPLPVNPYQQGGDNHRAYNLCLQLELVGTAWPGIFVADLGSTPPFEDVLKSMSPIVAARVLGHGLRYAPNDAGHDALVRDILSCNGNQPWMAVLAYLYVYDLIRVSSTVYNPKGPTPAVTPAFTPRASLEVAAPNPHLLQRSSSDASTLRALEVAANITPWTKAAIANVAHIITKSPTDKFHGITHQDKWASTAGAMIEHFGGFSAHDVLGEDNLHSPKNAFIASVQAHTTFDHLDMWLTPAMNAQQQVIPYTYKICHPEGREARLGAIDIDVDRPVVFRNLIFNGEIIPAPDHRIIALHAACAKIAHMSGAVEHLRELYRDTESIAVMTEPNATYELSRALRTLQRVSATA